MDATARFVEELSLSSCFVKLRTGWIDSIQIVDADLREADCGVNKLAYENICSEITHITHCAGSIKFDLPLAESAVSNITSTLNIYKLAQACQRLKQVVITSTAFVTSHTSQPIYEDLAPLPWPALQLFEGIQKGSVNEKNVLHATGHPNTYTLTKSIADHLMVEKRDGIPLIIVRPSIISAAINYPSPGWIDSPSTLAGFVIAVSSGMLRVVNADIDTVLDIVPVDIVAQVLINETFLNQNQSRGRGSKIVYAVSTLKYGTDLKTVRSTVLRVFGNRRIFRSAKVCYCGPRNIPYFVHSFLQHTAPLFFAKLYYILRRDKKKRQLADRGSKMVSSFNRVFPYFLENTFDFRPRSESRERIEVQEYLEVVCLGVEKHIMLTTR